MRIKYNRRIIRYNSWNRGWKYRNKKQYKHIYEINLNMRNKLKYPNKN
jgi:hypothetical protein